MEGKIYIINYLVCVFDVYLMYDFVSYYEGVKSNFEKRYSRICIILLTALAVFGVNLLNNTVINLCFTLIMNLLFICLVMNGSSLQKFTHFLIVLAVQYGGEFLTTIIFGSSLETGLLHPEYNGLFAVIIMKLVMFVLFTIIKQIVPKEENKLDAGTFIMFMTVPVASLGIMFSIGCLDIDFAIMPLKRGILLAFYIMLMGGNALVYYAFQRYGITQQKIHLQKKMIAEQKIELRHYQQVENINRRNAEFHHDMCHYLKVIGNLAEADQNKEILSILNQLQVEFSEAQKNFYCSNAIINTILNEESEEAKAKKLSFDIYVEPGFHTGNVLEADLVSILGNLYKNAEEAAVKCDRGFIRIQMFMQNEGKFAVIKFENSFTGEFLQEGDHFLTTKEEKSDHGIGVERVKELAERYHGRLIQTIDGRVFQSVLVLAI